MKWRPFSALGYVMPSDLSRINRKRRGDRE
jgi:hypothetical protein